MQVARYWRMKQHLYRLPGYIQETGKVTLDNRHQQQVTEVVATEQPIREKSKKLATVA